MTLDKVATALKKWSEEDDDRHFIFLAVGGEGESGYAVKDPLGLVSSALATTMRHDEQMAETIRFAMGLSDIKIFVDDDNDDQQDYDEE